MVRLKPQNLTVIDQDFLKFKSLQAYFSPSQNCVVNGSKITTHTSQDKANSPFKENQNPAMSGRKTQMNKAGEPQSNRGGSELFRYSSMSKDNFLNEMPYSEDDPTSGSQNAKPLVSKSGLSHNSNVSNKTHNIQVEIKDHNKN